MKTYQKIVASILIGVVLGIVVLPPIIANWNTFNQTQQFGTLQFLQLFPALQQMIFSWDSLTRMVEHLGTAITELNNTIIALGENATELGNRIVEVYNFYTNLQTTVNSHSSSITEILSMIENLQNQITSLQVNINEIFSNLVYQFGDYDYIVYNNGTGYVARSYGEDIFRSSFPELLNVIKGNRIKMLSGYYYTNQVVELANTKLVGAGKTRTIISMSNPISRFFTVADNNMIKDIGFEGVPTNLLYISGTGNLIDGISGNSSVYIVGNNNIIQNSEFTATQPIVLMANNFKLLNSVIYGKTSIGITGLPTANTLVEGNIIYGTLDLLGTNIMVRSNTIRDSSYAIYFQGSCTEVSIIQNYFYNLTSYVINFPSSVQNQLLITENVFDTTPYAIRNIKAKWSTISNNVFNGITTARIVDATSYDGTFFNDFHDGYPRKLSAPTIGTSAVYNTQGTQVEVYITVGSTSTTIYKNGQSIGSITNNIVTLRLSAGESCHVSQTTGVSWSWFSTG